MPCKFCGKDFDMYRHVARVPNSLCTTWKGSPQDCLEHLRNGHDAPWISKTASIEKYALPWTVRRELWTDSLRAEHYGISTDILLFSELGLSLTQHYRVYRGGLPHAVFRTDYIEMTQVSSPVIGTARVDTENRTWVDIKIGETWFILWHRGAEFAVRHTTWPQWACGALLELRYFLDPSRSPPATPAWPARTAFQMLRSDELTTSRALWEIYIQTLNIVYVIFG